MCWCRNEWGGLWRLYSCLMISGNWSTVIKLICLLESNLHFEEHYRYCLFQPWVFLQNRTEAVLHPAGKGLVLVSEFGASYHSPSAWTNVTSLKCGGHRNSFPVPFYGFSFWPRLASKLRKDAFTKSIRLVKWIKMLALGCVTWVWSLGPTRWKERPDSPEVVP